MKTAIQSFPIVSAPIILASQSPRRRRLLEAAGLIFRVIPSQVQEEDFKAVNPATYVKVLAEAKARDVAEKHPDSWVIGADSIVLIDEKILEKPASLSDARRMMAILSGKTHQVLTGYAIISGENRHSFTNVETTDVTFKPLTEEEIEWYIQTPEPYDKAGGYAIQGLGSFMVKQIKGSYTNVVGLPVCEVLDQLYRLGVISRQVIPMNCTAAAGNSA
ncbi:MAG: septum formation inhibitor Maf [Desulfobacteraceae bacterium]|nr:MAG: septum formation inhibitor Maf [Desulfobacteraceae bacterium]